MWWRYLPLLALAPILAVLAACGDAGDDDGDAPGGLVTAVSTAGAGAQMTLENEPYLSVRTLPSDALSAENLENAGTATFDDGDEVQAARAVSDHVAQWEVVTPAPSGWLIWQPQVVLDVLADAGPGAVLVLVEAVDWPDACLGAARDDEVCAQVITPGYRVLVQQDNRLIEYHTARSRDFRLVGPGSS